jgi:hypothetical protein
MHTFLTHPADVVTGRVFDANIFHPATGTLTYSDHLLLQSAVLTPVYALTHNAALCYNIVLLASLVASALAMHVFVSKTLGTTGGAYVAGLVWGFGSYRFAHLLHLQLQALYFLPLTFLFLHRVAARRRTRDAVVLGLFTGLQAIASVYYAVIGGLALVLGAVVLAVSTGPSRIGKLATKLLLAAVVAGALALPIAIVYLGVQQEEGFGRNLYEASHSEAYVDSYLQVPPGNLLYGRTGLLRRHDVDRSGAERELFPGFAVVVLAFAGAWFGWRGDARPIVASMLVIALAGFVLSLGPDGVRPLYAALHRTLFGFQAIRAASRFSVLVTFALATLAALGWREWASRVGAERRRMLPWVAVVVVALECAHVPTMLAAAPPLRTSVGQWLAHAPGDGAVAMLPVTQDLGNTPAMVQSLEFNRPIVNGYSGQRPSFYSELVDTLSTFPSPEALLALHDAGVQYVVTPKPIDLASVEPELPLVQRAHFDEGTIYELTWTPAFEERFTSLTTVVPPPTGPIPFEVGERATYTVKWDGAGVNLAAGEIRLAVEGPPYRLVATATTAPWVARFFEAQDRFVTTTDAMLMPLVHERDRQEGSRHVTRAFVYDAARNRILSGRTADDARGPEGVALPLPEHARDAISALYYVRTLPLEPGSVVKIPVDEAGRNLVVEIHVAGRERVGVGGQMVDAIRIEPRVRQRVERRQPVTGTVWLAADARRIPVRVELAAVFGHITLELAQYRAGT